MLADSRPELFKRLPGAVMNGDQGYPLPPHHLFGESMPTAPQWGRLAHQRARLERRRDEDRRRVERHPYRAWYKTARWQAIRKQQFASEPLCRMCAAEDPPRLTPMYVCDHVEPHRGDEAKFFAGPFQSLCEHHHNAIKQREERGR